jgi:hypothetical protein
MDLIRKTFAETVYEIKLSETELNTIQVALGAVRFNVLDNTNRSYEIPLRIVKDDEELSKLYDDISDIIDE